MNTENFIYSIILVCEIPKYLEELRIKNNIKQNIPPYITMAYLKNNIDDNKLENILKKLKIMNIKCDDICSLNNKINLMPSSETEIKKMCDKIKLYIDRLPSNDYHLNIANFKGKWDLYKNEEYYKKISDNIKLPIDIKITEMWLLKKNKKRWMICNKIKLK